MRALSRLDPAALAGVDVIGLSGNMSSVVVLDGDRHPVGPAVLLADTRGADLLAALAPAVRERIAATAGNDPAPVFSLGTLLWLAGSGLLDAPDTTFCCAKDWLRSRLCDGALATDVTDAGNTLLVDRDTRAWDLELVETLGLPTRALPRLAPSAAVVGRTSARAAELTGLPAGVPVVTGAGDMAALACGAEVGFDTGSEETTTALASLGTSMTVLLPDAGPALAGMTWHPMPDPGGSFRLASLVTGGLALNWLRDLTGTEPAAVPPGVLGADDPLSFVPHLAGTAYPGPRPDVRGALLGLRPGVTAADLAQSLFEALALELFDVLAARPDVERLLLTGGGTHVPGWVAAIAETVPARVEVLAEPEASARGAALLGLRGLGVERGAAGGRATVPVPPDPDRVSARRARRDRYRRARELVFHQSESPLSDCDGPAA